MVISRTPFRLSFFGGGTDYPAWYRRHGGSVLATTINKYCYITCRYLPPFFEHRYRVVWSRIENCQSIDDIQHPAVRAILQFLQVERGIEIHHDGDLPARSGAGSSSSFAVGLLNAVHALHGRMTTKRQLADEALHVEQELLADTVGSQDQVSAAHGGFNHITFHRNGQISVAPVSLRRDRIEELEAHLMLLYTGVTRTSSQLTHHYIDAAGKKEAALRIMQEHVQSGLAMLSGNRPIEEFGDLLHHAWMVKRSLGRAISNAHVDGIYAAAQEAGAIGGKVSGAGGGGFMLLFVPSAKQRNVLRALKGFVHVPFRFEQSGSQIIFYDVQEDFEAVERYRIAQQLRPFFDLDALPRAAEGGE